MIGSNDQDEDYMPLQVLVPILVSTIREYNARIEEVANLLKSEIPQELRDKYKEKLSGMIDSKYKLIYSMMDLNYDVKNSAFFNKELKELLGSDFYSKIKAR